MQLDEAERGFSFRLDGPLDMRMGGDGAERGRRGGAGVRARSRRHHRDARRGAHARAPSRARSCGRAREAPIRTTRALAEIVGRVVHARPGAIHPATRTFQALRMFVNDELGELAAALAAAERMLKPGGRLVVVAFHSLEDRIVKTFLRRARPAQRRLAPSAGSDAAARRPSAC